MAQLNGGADREQTRGPGPGEVPQAVFTSHRLGSDHTEGVTTLDMNGDRDIDIAVAGKTGVHLLENLMVNRVSPEQREKEIVLEKNWPFHLPEGEKETKGGKNGDEYR